MTLLVFFISNRKVKTETKRSRSMLHLAIQHTYDTFEIALFINHKLVDKISDDKRHTSKLFIPHLQQLLSKNAISFAELSFFCTTPLKKILV